MHTTEARTWTAVSRTHRELFRLTKGDTIAVCTIVSHHVGTDVAWELRLHIDTPDHVMTAEFYRSAHEIVSNGNQWKSKMLAEGWKQASIGIGRSADAPFVLLQPPADQPGA